MPGVPGSPSMTSPVEGFTRKFWFVLEMIRISSVTGLKSNPMWAPGATVSASGAVLIGVAFAVQGWMRYRRCVLP